MYLVLLYKIRSVNNSTVINIAVCANHSGIKIGLGMLLWIRAFLENNAFSEFDTPKQMQR